jgi:hypothetical protein
LFCPNCGARSVMSTPAPTTLPFRPVQGTRGAAQVPSRIVGLPSEKAGNFRSPSTILRLVGALIILVALALPYYATSGHSLIAMVTSLLSGMSLSGELPLALFVMITAFFLILLGGIIVILRGIVGAVVTIVGLLFLSITLDYFFPNLSWLSFIGPGYYAVAIGIVVVLASRVVGLGKKKQ